jgi:hypothetical protein
MHRLLQWTVSTARAGYAKEKPKVGHSLQRVLWAETSRSLFQVSSAGKH